MDQNTKVPHYYVELLYIKEKPIESVTIMKVYNFRNKENANIT